MTLDRCCIVAETQQKTSRPRSKVWFWTPVRTSLTDRSSCVQNQDLKKWERTSWGSPRRTNALTFFSQNNPTDRTSTSSSKTVGSSSFQRKNNLCRTGHTSSKRRPLSRPTQNHVLSLINTVPHHKFLFKNLWEGADGDRSTSVLFRQSTRRLH